MEQMFRSPASNSGELKNKIIIINNQPLHQTLWIPTQHSEVTPSTCFLSGLLRQQGIVRGREIKGMRVWARRCKKCLFLALLCMKRTLNLQSDWHLCFCDTFTRTDYPLKTSQNTPYNSFWRCLGTRLFCSWITGIIHVIKRSKVRLIFILFYAFRFSVLLTNTVHAHH